MFHASSFTAFRPLKSRDKSTNLETYNRNQILEHSNLPFLPSHSEYSYKCFFDVDDWWPKIQKNIRLKPVGLSRSLRFSTRPCDRRSFQHIPSPAMPMHPKTAWHPSCVPLPKPQHGPGVQRQKQYDHPTIGGQTKWVLRQHHKKPLLDPGEVNWMISYGYFTLNSVYFCSSVVGVMWLGGLVVFLMFWWFRWVRRLALVRSPPRPKSLPECLRSDTKQIAQEVPSSYRSIQHQLTGFDNEVGSRTQYIDMCRAGST